MPISSRPFYFRIFKFASTLLLPLATCSAVIFASASYAADGMQPMHAAPVTSALFSQQTAGAAIIPPYRILSVPPAKVNRFSFITDAGVTVLKVESDNSAGTIAMPITADINTKPLLTWRWKVDRALKNGSFSSKMHDDHAARVYVFFDVPLDMLSFSERTKIRLARSVSGIDIPTAALCYVWDNKQDVGFEGSSPFSDRVKKIVLQSGDRHANAWMRESRDVVADFKRAFGQAPPRITGVAVGSDTDQTGERVTTWFGDVQFVLPAAASISPPSTPPKP
jgi:Protein of unknown function (DUF3047)